MGKISTKDLFQEYFNTLDEEKGRKIRAQVDRPEVYEYESNIGKEFIDMDAEELFNMIANFGNNARNDSEGYVMKHSTFAHIVSIYRDIVNYYIDNYDIIKNQFNDKSIRGKAATEKLASMRKAFTKESFDEIIEKVHNEYDEPRANYYECIMQLFYNGFALPEEIVALTEDMIDFKHKIIMLHGRTIELSDRCFELLQYVHNLEELEANRGEYIMETWHDGYFKYPIRPNAKKTFQDRDMRQIASQLSRAIITQVRNKFDPNLNYRLLYYLGFYNYLEDCVGKDKARDFVLSVRNQENVNELMRYARMYGVTSEGVTNIKKDLRPYI